MAEHRETIIETARRQDAVREFATGATRDVDTGKNDFEAFLSPSVIAAYAGYMNACRMTATGRRDGDNWQKGIPLDTYMKSNWRHFFSLWAAHRRQPTKDPIIISCLAVMFNTMGYLHEYMKAHPGQADAALKWFEEARSAEIASRVQAVQAPPRP